MPNFRTPFRLVSAGVAALVFALVGLTPATAAWAAAPNREHAPRADHAVPAEADAFGTWRETQLPARAWVTALASDHDGYLWYADSAWNQLVRVNPLLGTMKAYPLGLTLHSMPAIAVTDDGAVWFADDRHASLGRLDPATGTSFPYAIPGAVQPTALVASGNTVFYPTGTGLASTTFTATHSPVASPALPSVDALAAGDDGRVWYAGVSSTSVVVYDPATGRSSTYDTYVYGIMSLVAAPDGGVWAGSRNALTHIAPDGAVSTTSVPTTPADPDATPTDLVVGHDAALYFVDRTRGVGRLDDAGALTFRTVPGVGVDLSGLAVSVVGSVWFLDRGRGILGWS